MAVSASFYGQFYRSAFNGELDLDTDTLKLMVCTASYVPDKHAHRYKSDVTSEVSGTGYDAGGKGLTNVVVSYDATSDVTKFDADDVLWNPITVTAARIAVLYKVGDSDATSPLIGWVDAGEDKTLTAGTLKFVWNAAGIGAVAVA